VTHTPLPVTDSRRAVPTDPAVLSGPHPDRAAEEAHLSRTLATLERRIDEVGNTQVQGFTTWDTVALHRAYVSIYQNLLAARKQVYFGRLDYTQAGAPAPETYYFGKLGFESAGKIVVVDWRAPVARLFSRRRPGAAGYDSPDGHVDVTLHLKRQYQVQGPELVSLHDEYDARPQAGPAGAAARVVDPDDFLRAILSGRGGAQMLDIVATIQEHQDDLIRADPRQVLVVQGVAGSGKTSIALHRVAYLLYPGNKSGIDGVRCIVFGPNQLFLGYIGNVLPELGVDELAQTTLDAWALERLGLSGGALADATQALLLSGAGASEAEKRRAVARSRVKASLTMGRLLENFANWWRGQISLPAEGLVFDGLGPLRLSVAVDRARALEIHRSLNTLPLARHRERFHEVLMEELSGGYADTVKRHIRAMAEEGEAMRARQRELHAEAARLDEHAAYAEAHGDLDLEESGAAAALARGATALRDLGAYYARQGERLVLRAARLKDEVGRAKDRREARAALGAALRERLERLWPPLDVAAGYQQLLGDLHLLARVGRGVVGTEELELLHRPEALWSVERGAEGGELANETIDVSDLPALCYLHLVVNGVPAPLYDHVVVDEAQDAAPLYYAALRRLSRNNSFTLLGDLAQGVYAYRGLADWDEARAVFAGLPYTYAEAADSYRSTHEIITFANRMLELLAPPGQAPRLARPFARHGEAVRLLRLEGQDDLAPALARAVRALHAEGYANVAVIAKTPEQCAALAAALGAEGLAVELVTETADHYAGGLVVLPVHLAKGMEFEAVLVAGAEAANFPATEFEGRLLYVAVTRALHRLEIFSLGEPNAYLELAHGGG
jgi:DNA helicase-2/ATP-dependent DNA helicase PcrA